MITTTTFLVTRLNTYKIGVIIGVLLLCHQSDLVAQKYIGIGWHLSTPVKFDNCCNPFLQANPFPASSFSLTYKKEYKNKNKKKWYYEIGLTAAAMGFTGVIHDNDTISPEGFAPWGIFSEQQIPFQSVLFGMGKNFRLKNTHEMVLGLEGSLRWAYVFGGSLSSAFTLDDPRRDFTFPLFLRANLGYAVPFKILKQIPAHLLFYTKVSAQNIAKGGQYIQDPITRITNFDGKYRLNNSEAGIQFYINIDQENYDFIDRPKRERRPRAKRTGKPNIRFSIEQQLYSPRPTQYYIPHVDSFSLKGHKASLTAQIGIKAEFVHFRNTNWSTVVMVGTGKTNVSNNFTATAAFTPAHTPIVSSPSWSPIGRYAIQNLGLSYRHGWGKKKLQHTFSVCAVEPLTNYASGFAVGDSGGNIVLEGDFMDEYLHHKVVIGVEYSPELMLNVDKLVFFGVGMVFNYSSGIMAKGRATVTNGTTTYYGGMQQRFSKIGLTVRMGLQNRDSALANRN